MLKRLELVGFKSFADKTRFDFAPGITAVVGPNGSGKSNVVDAVRWILGEQSAKTLRGGEMADVIFNGSSTRKSLGLAEVTVTFDNARRLLAVDADDVQVTRRVYRDGTGEYLINGQMSRLKDIKELFLGSGAGTGGYTIIAQGRVDEMLAASTKDRREIFEEAAGISRFRAKKHEALRKLEHVEGNLVRSRDRLESLEGQLRTLRLQAAKAQRYKEYADRLRELRVWLGGREFAELSAALAAEEAALGTLRAEVADATGRSDALEADVKRLDWEVGRADESLRHQEGKLADARQQIAGHDAATRHERQTADHAEAELLRLGKQRADLGYRIKALEADARRAAADADAAEAALVTERERATAVGDELAAAADRVAEYERRAAADRDREFDLVRTVTRLQSEAAGTLANVERFQKEYTRKRAEVDQATARREALEQAIDGLSRADADLRARLTAARHRLAGLLDQRYTLRTRTEELQHRLEGLRVRQSDLAARADVLDALERSHEGLAAGVRDVLGRIADCGLRIADFKPGAEPANMASGFQSAISNPQSAILAGLVADLLTVPREAAALVELALGDAAQRFVVHDPSRVDEVVAALGPLAGRVGFVPLGGGAARPWGQGDPAALSPDHPATLDALVRCDRPELAALPAQLLGDVAVADDLPAARRLAAAFPRLRVVTRAGELLEPDGTLTVGPAAAGAGLVSRKSELRDLRDQLHTVAADLAAVEAEAVGVRRQADAVEGVIEAVETEVGLLTGEAGGLQQEIARQREQVGSQTERIEVATAEARRLEDEVQRGEAAWVQARMDAEAAERSAQALRASLVELGRAIEDGVRERDVRQRAHTDAQVALSRAQADRDRARDKQSQLDAELRKRKVEAVDLTAADRAARSRLLAATLAMLRASAGAADAYREKEARERAAGELSARRAADRAARERAYAELSALRAGWQDAQSRAHARELTVRDLHNRRDALSQRLREDYAIELGQEAEAPAPEGPAAATPGPAGPSPAEANAEIDDLRKKLARLGSVNMEALDELTRVEAEATALQAQHDDLAAAQRSLREIIDRINADSRRLFTDTLTAVRGHFQELFRKLFGGGMADIVLEDGADVLESGVDITARPPGKELRSISLLSGGEKTLTAVALLLAIFQSKPSPFCLLDEVDAALDEANTQRLAGVLAEFREQSQFIVITHKKRTMAVAEVLHGVTMQESGVSKLVGVRFEDWPDEDGRPHEAAA